jgi:hypothetical protein
LLPAAPEVDQSDSIHPEAYARVKGAEEVSGPGLADREAVCRELIELCERELPNAKEASRRARLHYECGRLFENPLHDLDAALQHYLQARSLSNHHVPTLSGLRRVRLLRGEYKAALDVISQEIELCRSTEVRGALHFQRAVILDERLRQEGEARLAYEAALEQLPGDAATLRALARAHRRDREHQKLREVLDAQANVVGDEPPLVAARIAEHARNAELDEAFEGDAGALYQRAASTDALGSAALMHAARLHRERGQYSELVQLEQKRVELLSDPRLRAATLSTAAELLSEHLADLAGAIVLLEQAASEVPSDLSPLWRLAELYERLGDQDMRLRTLERLEAGSQHDAHQRLQLRLMLANANRALGKDATPAIH